MRVCVSDRASEKRSREMREMREMQEAGERLTSWQRESVFVCVCERAVVRWRAAALASDACMHFLYTCMHFFALSDETRKNG